MEKKMNCKNVEMVENAIVEMYLEKHPRKVIGDLKVTDFGMNLYNNDGDFLYQESYICPLTDEEYKDLFILLMRNKNKLTMNQLIYMRPELVQDMMKDIHENWSDCSAFILELTELKSAVKSVLDPFVDELGLRNSEDEMVKEYALSHEVMPFSHTTTHVITSEPEMYYYGCKLSFKGTNAQFRQYIHDFDKESSNILEEKKFECNAYELMEKLGLEKLEDIAAYMDENFYDKDSLERLRESLTPAIS